RDVRRPRERRVDPRRDRTGDGAAAAPGREVAGSRSADSGGLRGARVIVVDADVLGRNRTGEETYVLNLLRQLPFVAPDLTFGAVVPRAARKADHVLAVSERTKRDAIDLYGIPADKITVTPHGVDPAFGPGDGTHDGYLLFVGAVQARKDPLAAAEAAAAVGLPLVVAGPEKEPAVARE